LNLSQHNVLSGAEGKAAAAPSAAVVTINAPILMRSNSASATASTLKQPMQLRQVAGSWHHGKHKWTQAKTAQGARRNSAKADTCFQDQRLHHTSMFLIFSGLPRHACGNLALASMCSVAGLVPGDQQEISVIMLCCASSATIMPEAPACCSAA